MPEAPARGVRAGRGEGMRVAIFHDYLKTVGGAERLVLELAKALDADVISTDYDPAVVEMAGSDGVRVIDLGPLARGPPLKQIHASWKFARCRFPGYDFYIFSGNWSTFAAKRHHPNLLYCHTPTRMFYDQKEATLGRLSPSRRWFGRAWIALHGMLERKAIGHCDRILTNSANVAERVRRYYGREATVVYGAVPTSSFRYEEVGDTWLSVSRLYPEKRIDLLLEIFRRLPDQRLQIVGGYSPGDRAERYVATLQPPPNVTFLGVVSDARLRELYARCRGLITAAVDEDFGLTPIEAMASGKCVLATDEGGYRETVVPGETGFLLPADPEAFAAKIRELDTDALRAMRDACQKRAKDFDTAVFVERIREAIESRA